MYLTDFCCLPLFFLPLLAFYTFFYILMRDYKGEEGVNEDRFVRYFINTCKRKRKKNPKRIEGLIFFIGIVLLICVTCKKAVFFNDPELYYWIFSTLAQVFGALLGLIAVIITTLIINHKIIETNQNITDNTFLVNIRTDTKISLYPIAFVLIYSIIALALSQILIQTQFCKFIIFIFGIEIPILALFSLTSLMSIVSKYFFHQVKKDSK